MEIRENTLWFGGCAVEPLMQEYGSPLYVYEEEVIRQQYRRLSMAFAEAQAEIHYAMKANYNPALLKILKAEGSGIDAVSPGEVQLALELGFSPEKILFSGNNISASELRDCLQRGITVNIESLSLLEQYAQINPGGEASVRLNPGMGSGHHTHCITGGPHSKFGIYHDQIPQIHEIAQRYRLSIIGVHSHIGTGILEAEPMLEAMALTLQAAQSFPNLKFVDFGGGFGIPYRPGQAVLELEAIGQQMSARFREFCQRLGRPLRMKLEPGRFLIAQAGTLLATVTNRKHTPQYQFVGTDTGFNHLIRPTMYGSYHRIYNASRVEGEAEAILLAGNICESGDIFTQDGEGYQTREVTRLEIGDRVALLDAGAYGMAMSSQYNLRSRPAEVLVNGGQARLIRRRESYADLIHNFIF